MLAAVGSLWEWVAPNYALVSIVLTVTAMILVPVLILAKYVRLILPILKDTHPPLSRGPLDFDQLRGEEVDFRAFDGLALRGLILTGRHHDRPRGMLVFAHEFASDRHSCARYCRPLLEAGYDVFSFDFRGHGESSREKGYQPLQWVTDRELTDLEGALAFITDWLDRRGRPPEVGIFGISRGAGTAIISAVSHAQVRAIVCDGLFSSDKILEHFMKRWAYIFAKVRFVYENHHPAFWRLLRWLVFQVAKKQLNCTFPSVRKALLRMSPRPILFIHGARDSYIPVDHVRDLYAQAHDPKEMWVVPAAKHNQSVVVRPEQYASRTVAFFDEHLARGRTLAVEPAPAPVVAEAGRVYHRTPSGVIPASPSPAATKANSDSVVGMPSES